MGHLHRFQNIDKNDQPVVYSSSPLAYSFSEAGQEKKIIIIDAEPNKNVIVNPVTLNSGKPLIRKKFDDIDLTVQWLNENPYALVELTLVSNTFLSATDMKRIHEAHDGIVHIIPVVNQSSQSQEDLKEIVSLDKDIHVLFNDFFKSKYGQDPNEEIQDLFKEVLTYSKDLAE